MRKPTILGSFGSKASDGSLFDIDAPSIATSDDQLVTAALRGHVRWLDAGTAQSEDESGAADTLLHYYRQYGDEFLSHIGGSFSLVVVDKTRGIAIVAIDRFGVEQIFWTERSGRIYFGNSALDVLQAAGGQFELNTQSVYDFLYFHCLPSPATMYRGVHKLRPAECLRFNGSDTATSFHWLPDFSRPERVEFASLKDAFDNSMSAAVRSAATDENAAAFLSGGLDSSTVCGFLQAQRDSPVHAFSVGFAEEDYNELGYARIAARHFSLMHHEILATTGEAADCLDNIFAAFEEPFGNSSIVPTYLCAKAAAKEGFTTLLAGDGGDEIFAGNIRYAKQKVFEQYFRLPRFLRQSLLEPLFVGRLSGVGFAPIRKISRYVQQASVPLPARLESYNHLAYWPADEVFERDFLIDINPGGPLESLSKRFGEAKNADVLDRMLYLDWKITLADNDLRKVVTMCELAGVEARFPFLDERVVDLSISVPSAMKLRRLRLRNFFKNAMQDALPKEIIEKPKHGFGLPFGEWLKTSSRLQDMIYSRLADLGGRRIVRRDFVDRLIQAHREGHAAYFGSAVWVFMALEMWFRNDDSGVAP